MLLFIGIKLISNGFLTLSLPICADSVSQDDYETAEGEEEGGIDGGHT